MCMKPTGLNQWHSSQIQLADVAKLTTEAPYKLNFSHDLLLLYRRSGGRRRRHNALGRGGARHSAGSIMAVGEQPLQSSISEEKMSSEKALEHRDALYLARLCHEMDRQSSNNRSVLGRLHTERNKSRISFFAESSQNFEALFHRPEKLIRP